MFVKLIELAQHQHCRHDEVGEKSKEAEGDVRQTAESSQNRLQEGFGPGGADLHLRGDDGKEKQLNRRPRSIPERTADAVLKARVGGTKTKNAGAINAEKED
ncbi:unnamed protein product [Protopolystoma xenopodis]|uniref:Uncharacterized protein n=1 Tax=Protopolystoma xenopodis TaxID=117903 RepID=A0A448WZB3_9PLAT|nr:unnamed protein product [Protopolystoma xenopodis]